MGSGKLVARNGVWVPEGMAAQDEAAYIKSANKAAGMLTGGADDDRPSPRTVERRSYKQLVRPKPLQFATLDQAAL